MENPLQFCMRYASEIDKSLNFSSAESHHFADQFQRLDESSDNNCLR